MHIIKSTRDRSWISGVFATTIDADAYMRQIKLQEPDLATFEKIALPDQEFPLFIIERPADTSTVPPSGPVSWEFTDEEGAANAVWEVERDRDAEKRGNNCDHHYFVVYVIRGDWQPPHDQAGLDYMGGMDHYHIDGEALDFAENNAMPWSRTVL